MKIFLKLDSDKRSLLLKATFWRTDAWRPALRKSWYKRRYWAQGQGTRQAYRAQLGPWVLEWRVLDPKAVAKRGKHGELQD